MFATSSLDGKIRLWNLKTEKLEIDLKKSELKKQSKKGVLGISYSEGTGNYMVSWGFDYNVAVWNPVISMTRSFIGYYEGHKSILRHCTLFRTSPNCASIDEKNNLRVWDVRNFQTMQIINMSFSLSKISLIHVFNNDNFLLLSKRMFYIYNEDAKKKIKLLEEAYPLYADFNEYFKKFMVVTRYDIRIYDSRNGRLQNVFTEVLKKNKNVLNHITCYMEGSRSRKFYIGDNIGNICLYNMKNAEMLKEVNNLELENKEVDIYAKVTFFKRETKDNNDVTAILFVPEENILIVGTKDSIIKIYDESNAEESTLIRIFMGGHERSEITSLAYSVDHYLLASGSQNGLISIWNLANTKLESLNYCHKAEIIQLSFGKPFPVLIAASLDGTMSVWGHRPIRYTYLNRCLFRFLVFNYMGESRLDELVRITCMMVRYKLGRAEYNQTRSCKLYKRCVVQEDTGYDNLIGDADKSNMESPIKNSKQNSKVNSQEKLESLNNLDKIKTIYKENSYLIGHRKPRSKRKSIFYMKLPVEKNSIVLEGLMSVYKNPDKVKHRQKVTMDDFIKYQATAFKKQKEVHPHLYVYLTGKNGKIYVSDLACILESLKIKPIEVKHMKEKEDKIRREENLNVSKSVRVHIENLREGAILMHQCYDIYLSCLNFCFEAHNDQIVSITLEETENFFVTASKDKTVKIWRFNGEKVGCIDIFHPQNTVWNFYIDWVRVKLKEFEEVFKNLEIIEGKTYSNEEKDKIKRDFLYHNYIKTAQIKSTLIKKEPEVIKILRNYGNKLNLIKQQKQKKYKNIGGNDYTNPTNTDKPKFYRTLLHDTDFKEVKPITEFSKKIFRKFYEIEQIEEESKKKKEFKIMPVELKDTTPNQGGIDKRVRNQMADNSIKRNVHFLSLDKKPKKNRREFFKSNQGGRESSLKIRNAKIRNRMVTLNMLKKEVMPNSQSNLKRTGGVNFKNILNISKGRTIFKNSIKYKNFDPTDDFYDDYGSFKGNCNNKPRTRIRNKMKKKVDMPLDSINNSENIIRQHKQFLDNLSADYTHIGFKHEIGSARNTSTIMKFGNIKGDESLSLSKYNKLYRPRNQWELKVQRVLKRTYSRTSRNKKFRIK